MYDSRFYARQYYAIECDTIKIRIIENTLSFHQTRLWLIEQFQTVLKPKSN